MCTLSDGVREREREREREETFWLSLFSTFEKVLTHLVCSSVRSESKADFCTNFGREAVQKNMTDRRHSLAVIWDKAECLSRFSTFFSFLLNPEAKGGLTNPNSCPRLRKKLTKRAPPLFGLNAS